MAKDKAVAAARPEYPPFWFWLRRIAWNLRGTLLLALFTVYIVNHESMLPALVRYATAPDGSLAMFLKTNAFASWYLDKCGIPHENNYATNLVFLILCSVVIHAVMYFGLNGVFLFWDVTGLMSRFKLRRTPRMANPISLVAGTLAEGFLNSFVIYPLAFTYVFHKFTSFPAWSSPCPDVLTTWGHMLCAQYINEIGFFLVHATVHQGPLYRWIHKKHHTYVGSIGFAMEHAHPVEAILANSLPMVAYMLLMSPHQSMWLAWLMFRLSETSCAHSGYAFDGTLMNKLGLTWCERAHFHDWHHTDNRGNYGFVWTDWLSGTMDSYVDAMNKGKIGLPSLLDKKSV